MGGGTGMICYEFKGGTGTASRRLALDGTAFHVGALVQANHGIRPWFTVLGRRLGPHMPEDRLLDAEQGSIIAILATDLPAGTAPARAAGEACGDRYRTRRDARRQQLG